jgi:hypothetical protein
MKKVRIILAGAAVALASVGVFANSYFVDVFYRANAPATPGALCQTVVTTPVCETGNFQCYIIINNQKFYLSKRTNGGECLTIPYNQQ